MSELFAEAADPKILRLVRAKDAESVVAALSDATRPAAALFKGKPGQVLMLPDGEGADALLGLGKGEDVFALGAAALGLPDGDWAIESLPEAFDATQASIAWAMGGYQFTRYKEADRAPARLVPPEGADAEEARRIVEGVFLTRDLVNTSAEDMGPEGIEAAVRELGGRFGAEVRAVVGEDLLSENYPMIHAVGRAAAEAPRLIELEWGDDSHPRLALIGKGVAFDSGGLNMKGGAFMRLMKKDMGGAANAIGLASMIMDAELPVRLHLLIPAVENAVSGNAFRPGDVLQSRKGLTVEIDNTDAEGRLVLGDAITKAVESEPALMIDLATLTGAARVALGPEVAPFYTADEEFAASVAEAGEAVSDPVWRMPLWDGYDSMLDSDIADMVNSAAGAFAGSITAALFLRRFAGETPWAHFDIFAWNPKARPGRPKGGEMLAARAVYHSLKTRFHVGTR